MFIGGITSPVYKLYSLS